MVEQQPPRGARMAPFWGTVLAVAAGALLPFLACGGVLAAMLAAGRIVPGAARSVGSGPAVAIIHVRGVILIEKTSERYEEAFYRLTGSKF